MLSPKDGRCLDKSSENNMAHRSSNEYRCEDPGQRYPSWFVVYAVRGFLDELTAKPLLLPAAPRDGGPTIRSPAVPRGPHPSNLELRTTSHMSLSASRGLETYWRWGAIAPRRLAAAENGGADGRRLAPRRCSEAVLERHPERPHAGLPREAARLSSTFRGRQVPEPWRRGSGTTRKEDGTARPG